MKNKKGFTLIETLVTIAIVGIILLIAIPSIMSISRSIKKRELETKKEVLVSAAEKYAKNNLSEFGEAAILKIPVRTLIYYGYVAKEKECDEPIGCVINPVDNTSMNNEIITIKRNLSITNATWGSVEEGVYATFFWNGANNINGASFIITGCSDNDNCTITTPNITRTGYNILGWGENANSHQGVLSENEVINLTQNRTYYAVTKKDIVLTLNPNGGKFGDNSTASKVDSCEIYNRETSCTVNNLPTVSKSGNSFIGWYAYQDGSGVSYSSNSGVDLSSSTTLYAGWDINKIYVRYNGNGGTGTAPEPHTCNYDEECTLKANTFTKGNKIFDGWKLNNEGPTLAEGASIKNVVTSGEVTYYAQWFTYTCSNGDSLNPTYNKCEYNATLDNGEACYCSTTSIGTQAQANQVYCDDSHPSCESACQAAGFAYVVQGSPKCKYICPRGGTVSGSVCQYNPTKQNG